MILPCLLAKYGEEVPSRLEGSSLSIVDLPRKSLSCGEEEEKSPFFYSGLTITLWKKLPYSAEFFARS